MHPILAAAEDIAGSLSGGELTAIAFALLIINKLIDPLIESIKKLSGKAESDDPKPQPHPDITRLQSELDHLQNEFRRAQDKTTRTDDEIKTIRETLVRVNVLVETLQGAIKRGVQ